MIATGKKHSDERWTRLLLALTVLLSHPEYDPTVEGLELDKQLNKLKGMQHFQLLCQLSAMTNGAIHGNPTASAQRDLAGELAALIRTMFPLSFDEQGNPVGPNTVADASEATNAAPAERDNAAAAFAIEYPYGAAGKELDGLLATIEKNEGRPLTNAEKLQTVRAFNKAVNEGAPQTVTFNGEDGYLLVGTRELRGDQGALLGKLFNALR
jgi:hypothetical protein